MLLEPIEHHAGLANTNTAAARIETITADLKEPLFVWYGPKEADSASYFRVADPMIAIEYSPQRMGGNAANHIHGIYRDPANDYGARGLAGFIA